MAEQTTRGHRRRFISFDALIQDPTSALKTCLELLESVTNPENTANKSIFQNRTWPEDLSQATGFIDKSLKRQRPEITENEFSETNDIRNVRLIRLAETIYEAILVNIRDDQAISRAVDQLWPSVIEVSV
jgi:hypothetical protein